MKRKRDVDISREILLERSNEDLYINASQRANKK
jgi:hypothetical protein